MTCSVSHLDQLLRILGCAIRPSQHTIIAATRVILRTDLRAPKDPLCNITVVGELRLSTESYKKKCFAKCLLHHLYIIAHVIITITESQIAEQVQIHHRLLRDPFPQYEETALTYPDYINLHRKSAHGSKCSSQKRVDMLRVKVSTSWGRALWNRQAKKVESHYILQQISCLDGGIPEVG